MTKTETAMLTQQDKDFLAHRGITEAAAEQQLESFRRGFPYLRLHAAATVENGGIERLSTEDQDFYLKAWETYTKADKKVVKFVPASGAASRMFKDLFAFVDAPYDIPTTDYEKTFFGNMHRFAFNGDLDEACRRLYGNGIDALLEAGRYKDIVKALLTDGGLDYGNLPKGLLKFHHYNKDGNTDRVPFEEHLVEGALYATNRSGMVNVHYTVSPQHRELFRKKAEDVVPKYERRYDVHYNVGFSEQKPSTDTLAVDMDNEPFRNDDGSLLLRPGGHGALIENLNETDADIVFVKNIDNVASDRMKPDTVLYKKVLAGMLVTLQQKVFYYLNLLESGKYTHEQVVGILQFVQRQLHCKNPDVKNLEDAELVIYLKHKLNRPMRVCGMVRNVGEPGGGPFMAYNADGTISLQILESSQIDMDDPEKKAMFLQGTHFNPVDLVCGITDFRGHPFDLTKYVDRSTGFISHKSKNGRGLKALELPGLWNGAMSDWNTVFVEVPLSTFNPVKVVNDLLREAHQ